MAMNASGIRDTARVLKISPTTVINELKKKNRTSRWNFQAKNDLILNFIVAILLEQFVHHAAQMTPQGSDRLIVGFALMIRHFHVDLMRAL